MSDRVSVFHRLRQFFWPARESYDTRRARGGEPGSPPASQYYEATDRRRSGGSGDIGAV